MRDPSSSARAIVQTLLRLEHELPADVRQQITALGELAAPHLMTILLDDRLTAALSQRNPYPQVHAIQLLADLGVVEAIEPAVRILEKWAVEDKDRQATGDLAEVLPSFGPPLLEPALAAYARSGPEVRWLFSYSVSRLGIRDERIFEALTQEVARNALTASALIEYGDARALEHLHRAYDQHAFDTELGFYKLRELHRAITALGGALTPTQQQKWREAQRAWTPRALESRDAN